MIKVSKPIHYTPITFWQLMLSVLKVGGVSFGGYMALVSMLKEELVERRKAIDDKTIMESVALASLMPGPLAVNIVMYLGYKLRGYPGALVGLIAILLPAFVLVYALSYLYFEWGNVPRIKSVFEGVMPAVAAIIFSVGYQMTEKHINYRLQGLIAIVAVVGLLWFSGFMAIVILFVIGGLVGYFFLRDGVDQDNPDGALSGGVKRGALVSVLSFGTCVLGLVLLLTWFGEDYLGAQLFSVFGTMSLTLFGGGYVFIPMMQEVVVESQGWLSETEFIDGIALGQVSPGPIMITSVFIGYKLMGLVGALIATIGMFLPSGLLMIVSSGFVVNNAVTAPVMKGIYAVTIGMIFSASIQIGIKSGIDYLFISIFIGTLFFLLRYKVSPVIVIISSGLIGFLVHILDVL